MDLFGCLRQTQVRVLQVDFGLPIHPDDFHRHPGKKTMNILRSAPAPIPIIESLILRLGSVKPWQAALPLVTYFSIIAWLDFYTGDELVLALLYMPVIAFISLRIGLQTAINLSLVCSAIWVIDDAIVYWNQPSVTEIVSAVVHFMCFSLIATVMSRLNIALRKEYLNARLDHLTGLPNVRTLREEAGKMFSLARRKNDPVTVIFLDCDNFKLVNDTQGHDAGDHVLQVVAKTLELHVRESDCTARFGGDEFVAMMYGMDLNNAQAFTERLRKKLLEQMKKHDWPITFSIGLVNFAQPPEDIEDAIKPADQQLNHSKHASKDAIVAKQAS